MAKFNPNHTLEILKAAFPYLDSRSKHNLEFFIKAGDFFDCLQRGKNKDSISTYNFEDDKDEDKSELDMIGMLKNIREVCYNDEIKIVDSLLNVMNAMELYETYQNIFTMMSSDDSLKDVFGMSGDSMNIEDMIEMLSLMLDPEDKETLDNINMILHMMKGSNGNNTEESNTQNYENDYDNEADLSEDSSLVEEDFPFDKDNTYHDTDDTYKYFSDSYKDYFNNDFNSSENYKIDTYDADEYLNNDSDDDLQDNKY